MRRAIVVSIDGLAGFYWNDPRARMPVHTLLGPPKYLGTHGQLPTHADNAAFFLAAGAGIRRGIELGPITSRDVTPTLAHVLAIQMDDVEGRVLTEALA